MTRVGFLCFCDGEFKTEGGRPLMLHKSLSSRILTGHPILSLSWVLKAGCFALPNFDVIQSFSQLCISLSSHTKLDTSEWLNLRLHTQCMSKQSNMLYALQMLQTLLFSFKYCITMHLYLVKIDLDYSI